MADDVTYTSTSPAGLPDTTKQVTDEHATRGHMPVVKIAYSADEIFSILMGEQVEPRREFIERFALQVGNLDI